jgi:hypothetical protein
LFIEAQSLVEIIVDEEHVYSSATLLQSNHKEPGLRQLLMRKPIENSFIIPPPQLIGFSNKGSFLYDGKEKIVN